MQELAAGAHTAAQARDNTALPAGALNVFIPGLPDAAEIIGPS
jgi:hypothetical protein